MKASSIFHLVVLSALLLGCHAQKKSSEALEPKVEGEKISLPEGSAQRNALTVEAAQPRQVTTISLTGRLIWNDEATVRVFTPVAGRVTAISVNLGQAVAAGDVLAKIASPDFGQAQADARKAAADLVLAERNLARLRELLDHGAAARKDLEAAEDAFASAQSEKQRATSRLKFYCGAEDLADQMFPLKAPLGGVVVEKNLNPGQEVRADQMLANAPNFFAPLFVISDPTQLWLLLDVTEQDITALKPGQAIHIHSKAYPDQEFPGKLEVIGDALDPATRTVKVRGAIPNPNRLLKAEMYVTADVVTDGRAGLDISAKAVFLKDNKPYVFVEQAPGQYERRPVKLGSEINGKISVLEGLHEGQRVVTEGCLLLQTLLESGNKT